MVPAANCESQSILHSVGPSATPGSLCEQVSLSSIIGSNQRQPRTWWDNPSGLARGQLLLDLSGKLWGPNVETFFRTTGLLATSDSYPQQLAKRKPFLWDRQDD